MMTKPQFLFLTLLLFVFGCAGLKSTPSTSTSAIIATDTPLPATTIPSPTILSTTSPTVTPTSIAATPAATLAPTPAAASRWQCDAFTGGLACYATLTRVQMLSPDEGWAWGGSTVLKYATPPGWQQVDASVEIPFEAVLTIGSDEKWITQAGKIIYEQNGTRQEIPIPRPFARDLVMLSPDEGWAVGNDGEILHYTQGEWQAVPSPTDNTLTRIIMLSPTEGWAVGASGTVLHYQDGQWQPVLELLTPYLYDLEFVTPDEGWAVGDTLLHYQNDTWQEVTPAGLEHPLYAVKMISAEEGWGVGRSGTILHYQNGQWQPEQSPTTQNLFDLSMVNSGEGWAVGENSTMLHYHDGGWELVSEASPHPSGLSDVTWLENGEGWAVGSRGTIMRYGCVIHIYG